MLKSFLSVTFSLFFLAAISQIIPAGEVRNNVGKTVTVSGKVVDGAYLNTAFNQPTLLNIDKAFPNQVFTVVIFGENRKGFGYKPEEVLLGKNISVTGKVTMYKGKPQVEVLKPENIVFGTAATNIQNGKETRPSNTGEVVLKSTVKLREGPGIDYKNISKLKPGSLLKILYTEQGWSYVSVTKNQGKEDLGYSLVGFIKNDELK